MQILYVDDDPDDAELFLRALARLDIDCDFIQAANGVEAVHHLNTLRPDIIFLDVNMPILNGGETLKLIRLNSALKSIPVFMFSTFISDEHCIKYKQTGATDCIVKPQSFGDLCMLLKNTFLMAGIIRY